MTKKVWKKVLVHLGDSDIQVYKIKHILERHIIKPAVKKFQF